MKWLARCTSPDIVGMICHGHRVNCPDFASKLCSKMTASCTSQVFLMALQKVGGPTPRSIPDWSGFIRSPKDQNHLEGIKNKQ